MTPSPSSTLHIAVIGAGPVGLALALRAARQLPHARITVFDARALDKDLGSDPRTLALSLGSVQMLQRLNAWPAEHAQPIAQVHVSQAPPTLAFGDHEPAVWLRAADEAVPMLGAVLSYGQVLAPLQRAWLDEAARAPQRLGTRFGAPVAAVKALAAGVEVDAGVAETFDLAVIAEGGLFADQPRKAIARDYGQVAWIGEVSVEGGTPGMAIERFTANGPVALLPLRDLGSELAPRDSSGDLRFDPPTGGRGHAAGAVRRLRAALVWCVAAADDPVQPLDDAQRLALLATQLPAEAGRVVSIGALKRVALGLNAERTLVDGCTVRIGNAAQTLHPVAGQGLNLGLRDAFELVRVLRQALPPQALSLEADPLRSALRRVEWSRASDRWTVIAATDFLARSFTWKAPGLAVARGLGLAALQALPLLKTALARHMMFGRR